MKIRFGKSEGRIPPWGGVCSSGADYGYATFAEGYTKRQYLAGSQKLEFVFLTYVPPLGCRLEYIYTDNYRSRLRFTNELDVWELIGLALGPIAFAFLLYRILFS